MIKDLAILSAIAIAAWYGYTRYEATIRKALGFAPALVAPHVLPEQFKCDGRVYCSQMTSCQEATFFLRNCPGTKMEGNGDGVPCEKQWCKP